MGRRWRGCGFFVYRCLFFAFIHGFGFIVFTRGRFLVFFLGFLDFFLWVKFCAASLIWAHEDSLGVITASRSSYLLIVTSTQSTSAYSRYQTLRFIKFISQVQSTPDQGPGIHSVIGYGWHRVTGMTMYLVSISNTKYGMVVRWWSGIIANTGWVGGLPVILHVDNRHVWPREEYDGNFQCQPD